MTGSSGNAQRISLVAAVQMRACLIKCLVVYLMKKLLLGQQNKQLRYM